MSKTDDNVLALEIEIAAEITSETPRTVIRPGGGIGWLALSSVIWGTVGVSSVLLNRVEATPPLWIGFLRLAFASPFLLGLAWFTTRRNPFRLSRREWFYYSVMGLAMAFYQVAYFLAISISSVTLAAVVALCSSPLIVSLLSIPIFKERLNGRLLAALALALSGTVLLALGGGKGGDSFKPEYMLGALLALGSGLGYSILAIFSKLATRLEISEGGTVRGPIQPIAVAFTLGAIVLVPVTWLGGSFKPEMAAGVWGIAAYMGLVPTGVAYIIFLKGIAKASATTATITTMLEPSVATLLAWALLGEQLTAASLVGSVLLLLSVLILSKRS